MLTCENIILLTETFTVSIIQTLFTVDIYEQSLLAEMLQRPPVIKQYMAVLSRPLPPPGGSTSLKLLAAL